MTNIDKNELHNILRLVLHNGLTETKVKNSNKVLPLKKRNDNDKKGIIAAFRSKQDMTKAKGFTVSSYEALFENDNKLTHWTPNEFSWLGYTKDKHELKGHSEHNLNQINAFIVDVDFKDSQERDLNKSNVMESLLLGYVILPTLVLKTDKGYQIYYVLKNPAFINKKGTRYPVLEVSKMISNNIKSAIKDSLDQVDISCNNFGIFRIPRQDNVIYFQPEMTVNFSELLNWSKKYYLKHKSKLTIVNKNKISYGKQIEQPWFNWLLHKTDIKPGMGIGRHNTDLTLALACYSSSMSENDCYNLLDEFNTNLKVSLDQRDLERCIKDAYSGVYQGASSIYINELIETWATKDEFHQLKNSKSKNWYKFAKSRKDRKYSHKHEWKQDLIKLFNKASTNNQAVAISTRNIQKKLGISPSSLNRVLKSLKDNNQVIIRSSGNNQSNAYLTLYLLVKQLQSKKSQYRLNLFNSGSQQLSSEINELKTLINKLKQGIKGTKIIDIGEVNTG